MLLVSARIGRYHDCDGLHINKKEKHIIDAETPSTVKEEDEERKALLLEARSHMPNIGDGLDILELGIPMFISHLLV